MTSFVREPLSIPPGETVCWSGAPRRGLILRSSDWLAVPFSLLWGGFAIFWETMVFANPAPFFFKLWGVPFVCVGLYMIVGRFFWDANVRSRTRYVVTDRAAYIEVRGFHGSVRRYTGSALDDVRVERKREGSGTLRFGADERFWGPWGGGPLSPIALNAFEAISDVDAAYHAVRGAGHG
jgi:hypothetical protein